MKTVETVSICAQGSDTRLATELGPMIDLSCLPASLYLLSFDSRSTLLLVAALAAPLKCSVFIGCASVNTAGAPASYCRAGLADVPLACSIVVRVHCAPGSLVTGPASLRASRLQPVTSEPCEAALQM